MRKLFYPYYVLLAACCLAGCTAREIPESVAANPLEIEGVQAVIVKNDATKAVTPPPLVDYVGRSAFKPYDEVVFTKICRTQYPLDAFTYPPGPGASYTSIKFKANSNVGWQRHAEEDLGPERIYWTDAASGHTFIAYGEPQDSGTPGYDWKSFVHSEESTSKTYYIGSLGNPLLTGEGDIIDYSLTAAEQAENKKLVNNVDTYYNPKLEKEDLVIAYDTDMVAEPGGSVALVKFYHALSSVRVVVNISGFSSSSTAADNDAVVSDMVLLHQPTLYAWEQSGFGTQPLRAEDQTIINGAWADSDTKPQYNQRKNIKLWIPRPAGAGDKQTRTFTFYGITTPQPSNYLSTLVGDNEKYRLTDLSFDVTYPDPLKPSQTVTRSYKASIENVRYEAGYNTTINISLNHKNEQMTVGAEYENWQFVATPDVSELFKNSTFLQDTYRFVPGTEDTIPNVTIVGDEKATVDDATWLYKSVTDGKVYDIYGHDGSSITNAYQISTAYQLLSFAYEVKAGRDFSGNDEITGRYIRLDADLTLQKSSDKTKEELWPEDEDYSAAESAIDWIGIGDATHAFDGIFLGGERFINNIKGSPLFAKLGSNAQIIKLQVSSLQMIDGTAAITGTGLLADTNEGLISACKVSGDVVLGGSPAGAFVGMNAGTIYACYHIGATKGSGTTGGLVGSNSGTVRNSYHVGKVSGSTRGGIVANGSGTLSNNYYNSTLLSNPTVDFEGAAGKSTHDMTMPSFVTALNIGIGDFTTPPANLWSFVLRPADYPKIGEYKELDGWLETDLSLISSTDRFVIVGNNGSNYAMTNDNGDSKSPSAVPVNVKDGAIPDIVPSNLQWTWSSPGLGYTFHPFGYSGVSLYISTDLGETNRNVNVRAATDNNVFTIDADGFLQNTDTDRFLGIYNSEEWRSYLSHTNKTDNINNQVFKFFKFYADAKNANLTLSYAGTVRYGDGSFDLVISNPHGVTYELSSSDANVATVTHEGNVTVKKAGTVTLSAAWAAQNPYNEGQYDYVLTIWKTKPTISFADPTTSIDLASASTITGNVATVDPAVLSSTLVYSSSNPWVASVDAATGEVTARSMGTATIRARITGNDDYDSASAEYTLTVNDTRSFNVNLSARPSAGGSVAASGTTVQVVGTTVTLTPTPQQGYAFRSWRVTKADDPSVIVSVTGNTFVMPGYDVNVTGYFCLDLDAEYYVKVPANEPITDGDYLIVFESSGTEGRVLKSVSSSNIGEPAEGNVTISASRISWNDGKNYNITIGNSTTSSGARMKLGDKYLAYTGSGNNLYAVDYPEEVGTLWTLSYNNAQNVASSTRYLRWNTGSPRFCCYTSGDPNISFYKLQNPKYAITIADGITGGTVATTPASSAEEGATVMLSATPSTGYALNAWDVYKTGDSATKITVTDNTFTMPAYGVTVSASFNAIPTINMLKSEINDVPAAGVTGANEAGVYEFQNEATDTDVTVTCDGTVVTSATRNNGAITYTVAANTGAARSGWIRVKYGTESAHEITVNQQAATYTLTVASVDHGTISATVGSDNVAEGSTLTVACGATVTLAKTADSGYILSWDIYQTEDSSTKVTPQGGSFTMPANNVTVSASVMDVSGYSSKTLSFSYSEDTVLDNVNVEGVGIAAAFAKNGGSTAPKYFVEGSSVRWYGSNTMTITAGGNTIKAIVITYSRKNKVVTANVGTYDHNAGTWSGSETSVTFTVEGGSGHNRITAVTVYYVEP